MQMIAGTKYCDTVQSGHKQIALNLNKSKKKTISTQKCYFK